MATGSVNPFHVTIIILGVLIALFLGGILTFFVASENGLPGVKSLLNKVLKGGGDTIADSGADIEAQKEGLKESLTEAASTSAGAADKGKEAIAGVTRTAGGVAGETGVPDTGGEAGETSGAGAVAPAAGSELPLDVEEDAVSPALEPAAEAETPEILAASENTAALCSNGLDDDGNGVADGRDIRCVGIRCPSGGQWTWSHLRTGQGTYLEDAGTAPARVGCVNSDQCINAQGNPVNQHVFYTDRWICGQSQSFFRCQESSDLGARRGNFECRAESGSYRWVDTTAAPASKSSSGEAAEDAVLVSIIYSEENTRDTCTDDIDNDGNGAIDELDRDCVGVVCAFGGLPPVSRYWVWSYLPEQDQNQLPPLDDGRRRIACCTQNSCANIDGDCINYDAFYTNRYICGDNNNWDRCDSGTPFRTSDGGNYACYSGNWISCSTVQPPFSC